jgi:hypothetical protein
MPVTAFLFLNSILTGLFGNCSFSMNFEINSGVIKKILANVSLYGRNNKGIRAVSVLTLDYCRSKLP